MTAVPRQFEPFPEDWTTALGVVAHPDDMEYGASAAVARWTGSGKTVSYLLVTHGEAGIDGMEPAAASTVRDAEQRAACDAVGVETLEYLDHSDGMIEYGLDLRRDIARAVRRHRPELVVTLTHREQFAGGGWNMSDHIAVGRAVLDAVRDAGNRWVFTELGDEGLDPWNGVRYVALSGSPLASHAVDVTESIDRGVASLLAHEVYFDGLGDSPMSDAGAFLRQMAQSAGERFGGRPAASFELVEL
ncbi:MAG: PIG-L family deacetylase [Actinomycetota bacterium]|nr:PIG-L family deacetylase [Actinomycetota bacterium]